jgi:hypothetical protein
MELNEVKRKFVEEVKLRAYDDKYIDQQEEREILQLALREGVTVDAARSALMQVCEAHDFVLESKALGVVKDTLSVFAGNDGAIDEKEFNDAVSVLKLQTKGKKNETQVKRMVLSVIDDNSYKTKTGWFSNWHKAARREVGLA